MTRVGVIFLVFLNISPILGDINKAVALDTALSRSEIPFTIDAIAANTTASDPPCPSPGIWIIIFPAVILLVITGFQHFKLSSDYGDVLGVHVIDCVLMALEISVMLAVAAIIQVGMNHQ